MRINGIFAAKIIKVFPILFMLLWIGAVVFGIVSSIADKVTYNKAMKRSVEVSAVCEEIYNSGYTENGIVVEYATVSFEYEGKTEKINHVSF